jgi:2-isopropylmalate synthase
MREKRTIFIYDSVREAEQSTLFSGSVTAQDIVDIMALLCEFGVPFMEGPWPVPIKGDNDPDREKLEKARRVYSLLKNMPFSDKVVVFGSTMEKTAVRPQDSLVLQNLVATGLKNFCIYGKSWDAQVRRVLGTTLSNNLRLIEKSVRFLKNQGCLVFFDLEHFFEGFKAQAKRKPEKNYAIKCLQAAIRGGADVLIFCDTNGSALPEEVESILKAVLPFLGNRPWGVHFHDDEGLAKANTLKAIDLGATYPQVTTLGHSERVGMVRLTDLVPTLILKKGYKCEGIEKLENLTRLAKTVAQKLGEPLQRNLPYVGSCAFGHKAGTHTKRFVLQEHITPQKVGNTRHRHISGLLGPSGIRSALKDVHILVKPDSNLLKRVCEDVKGKDEIGFTYGSATGSFAVQAMRLMPVYIPPFKIVSLESYCHLYQTDKWRHESRADIEVSLPGKDKPIVVQIFRRSEDGPVDAVDNVLKNALSEVYPIVNKVELVDYSVRIIKNRNNGKKGTASRVRVTIIANTPYGQFETSAFSRNIILASALALIDLYELVVLYQKKRHKTVF